MMLQQYGELTRESLISELTQAETCDDAIQNQDETGIDCGGSCEPCESEITEEKPQEITEEVQEEVIEEEPTQFYEEPEKKTSALAIIMIFTFLSVLLVGAFIVLKKDYFGLLAKVPGAGAITRFKPFGVRPMPPPFPRTRYRLPQAEYSYTDLINYIQYYMAQGKTHPEIRDWLLRQGWTSYVINEAFKELYRAMQQESQLEVYIATYLKQGRQPEEIKAWLLSRGWNNNVIEQAFSNLK